MTENAPASAGATPIVPIIGTLGIRMPVNNSTVPFAMRDMRKAGSVKRSASRPKPGMFAVQPHVSTSSSRISTTSASPGFAPSTKIGPVTGLTRPKSSVVSSLADESEELPARGVLHLDRNRLAGYHASDRRDRP